MRYPVLQERREARRHPSGDCSWLSQARLRHGLDLLVVDLANGGACVEAPARLLPGSSVELHLAAPGWQWTAAARVLRCQVSALVPERGVRYRAALQFDRQLTPPTPWTAEDDAYEVGKGGPETSRRSAAVARGRG